MIDERDVTVDQMCLFLVAHGVQDEIVGGYHSGWPLTRLARLYLGIRKQEVMEDMRMTAAVAIGACTILDKGKGLKRAVQRTKMEVAKLSKDDERFRAIEQGTSPHDIGNQNAEEIVEGLDRVFGGLLLVRKGLPEYIDGE